MTPEDALPMLYARLSQLRTLITAAQMILEPLGEYSRLNDARQLLATGADLADGAMALTIIWDGV